MSNKLLHVFDSNEARRLWQKGFGTQDIASRLKVHEADIYNAMGWLKLSPAEANRARLAERKSA